MNVTRIVAGLRQMEAFRLVWIVISFIVGYIVGQLSTLICK